jgi:hypothetical protein
MYVSFSRSLFVTPAFFKKFKAKHLGKQAIQVEDRGGEEKRRKKRKKYINTTQSTHLHEHA